MRFNLSSIYSDDFVTTEAHTHVAFMVISQKIKLFWAQICITLKKVLKRNPSILWNSFWELSWKSQEEKPKKIIYGELCLLLWICAYTLIHLIKLFKQIMGCKTRDIE